MLRKQKDLKDYVVEAPDGVVGKVHDFLFDDRKWKIQFLVVDVGTLLPGRKVLVPYDELNAPNWEAKRFFLDEEKGKIENGPALEEHEPVSQQYQTNLYSYFGWTPYWGVGAPYSMVGAQAPVLPVEDEKTEGDPHLRSCDEVSGYHIVAQDGKIGHVEDFLVDDADWKIRYLEVDTRNWLPGKHVILSPQWATLVDENEGELSMIRLTREQIKESPEYDPTLTVDRAYELALHQYYGVDPYWF